jgi:hypothetical protein
VKNIRKECRLLDKWIHDKYTQMSKMCLTRHIHGVDVRKLRSVRLFLYSQQLSNSWRHWCRSWMRCSIFTICRGLEDYHLRWNETTTSCQAALLVAGSSPQGGWPVTQSGNTGFIRFSSFFAVKIAVYFCYRKPPPVTVANMNYYGLAAEGSSKKMLYAESTALGKFTRKMCETKRSELNCMINLC